MICLREVYKTCIQIFTFLHKLLLNENNMKTWSLVFFLKYRFCMQTTNSLLKLLSIVINSYTCSLLTLLYWHFKYWYDKSMAPLFNICVRVLISIKKFCYLSQHFVVSTFNHFRTDAIKAWRFICFKWL